MSGLGEYTVYRSGEVTRMTLTDDHGRTVAYEMPTESAREFFRRGSAALDEPKTLGALLLQKLRLRSRV